MPITQSEFRESVTGVYTHADDLTEQTIVEITADPDALIVHPITIDCTELTKTTAFRVYVDFGDGYRRRFSDEFSDGGLRTYDPATDSAGPAMFFWLDYVLAGDDKIKVTAQTTALASEGATRDLRWNYGTEPA